MKIKASCNRPGTLILGTDWSQDKGGNSISGNLADYALSSPEKLHEIAKDYTCVLRPGKKNVGGDCYTLQMARNDFKNFAANS